MRALVRAHGETFDFLLENQAVLVKFGFDVVGCRYHAFGQNWIEIEDLNAVLI